MPFLVAMFLMAISPGPANLFFIRTGLSGSRARVFAGVIGTNSASVVWLTASTLGLQALMMAFPLAFRIIAVLGGLYVGWLGFKTARHALHVQDEVIDPNLTVAAAARTPWQTLREGFMVQILNPKMVLFLSAVLPPFIDLRRPMIPQMTVFAASTIAMDVISMTAYGLLAVRLAHLLREPRNKQTFDLAAGSVLMLVSALILFHGVGDLFSPH
ncbi:MAG: LysE family translocator [Asticcacaulis sp.]